eukprot:TRINITY_DN6437_c0_g1_i1.p3 TRINITY_DN6437_c0_g1~~TRINITY_DN6437_c0_g1_i1.p3  ORF type:complete len:104 (+),score=8.06 TRINITY_DN6437_c0_g1_i1:169-480(+)
MAGLQKRPPPPPKIVATYRVRSTQDLRTTQCYARYKVACQIAEANAKDNAAQQAVLGVVQHKTRRLAFGVQLCMRVAWPVTVGQVIRTELLMRGLLAMCASHL